VCFFDPITIDQADACALRGVVTRVRVGSIVTTRSPASSLQVRRVSARR
jgi:hypothetical protein